MFSRTKGEVPGFGVQIAVLVCRQSERGEREHVSVTGKPRSQLQEVAETARRLQCHRRPPMPALCGVDGSTFLGAYEVDTLGFAQLTRLAGAMVSAVPLQQRGARPFWRDS